jgi:hypothetical protein
MSKERPVPFIFGPMDGKSLLLDPAAEWYEVAEVPPIRPLPIDDQKPPTESSFEIKKFRYKRRVLNMSNGYFLDFFSPYESGQKVEWAFFFALKRVLERYVSDEERKAMQERFRQQEAEILRLREAIFHKHRELRKLQDQLWFPSHWYRDDSKDIHVSCCACSEPLDKHHSLSDPCPKCGKLGQRIEFGQETESPK